VVPGGDHVILVGAVKEIDSVDSPEGPPLVYGRRTFGAHTVLSA
jgi:flavin reductase (DIM6/NTAB) family NADH-FMN oxidoreductase RutF